jgi:UDP-glucose:(heptosyl)LPS alpha-1,3-glucosyltransferase
MKIAIVVKQFTRSAGGLERYAGLLARGLIGRGHEVDIYAQAWGRPGDPPEEPHLHFHRVPVVRKPAWLQALLFHWGVKRALARQSYDIVMGSGVVLFYPQHVYRLGGGLMVEWLRRRYPSRLVRTAVMMVRPIFLVNSWLEQRLLSGRVTHLIANSKEYKEQAVRAYGVPSDRISVIYNGYDRDQFHPDETGERRRAFRRQYHFPDDSTVLLFVSQDFKRKGLDYAIAALPAVLRKNPRVWLMVVGKDRQGRFLSQARRLGVDRRVVFVGATDSVEQCYVGADALVLPTRYDPFANVCLEAMACGLPVVTSRINGASELIADGKNGYVINDPADADGLADRLCRLLDPAHRLALGRAAIQTASRYSVERHLDEMARLFERIRAAERPTRELRASLVRLSHEMVVHGEFRGVLERHHLHRFETLMGYDEGTMLKDRKGKRIFQLRLEWQGGPIVLYLKRHRLPLSGFQRLAGLAGRPVLTEGRREWEHILAFHDRLLPTVTPVAMGERVRNGVQESFVLTKGLDDCESLEHLAPKRFVPPLTRELIEEKRRLIRAVAELTGRMHWSGFYHRDYNLVHLLLRRGGSPEDLRIIDLQRVLRYPWLRYRWRVKDIATIHHQVLSISGGILRLTRADLFRFLRYYRPDLMRNRWFLRAVRNKSGRIARHAMRSSR